MEKPGVLQPTFHLSSVQNPSIIPLYWLTGWLIEIPLFIITNPNILGSEIP